MKSLGFFTITLDLDIWCREGAEDAEAHCPSLGFTCRRRGTVGEAHEALFDRLRDHFQTAARDGKLFTELESFGFRCQDPALPETRAEPAALPEGWTEQRRVFLILRFNAQGVPFMHAEWKHPRA